LSAPVAGFTSTRKPVRGAMPETFSSLSGPFVDAAI
jgi:hypothetical protein